MSKHMTPASPFLLTSMSPICCYAMRPYRLHRHQPFVRLQDLSRPSRCDCLPVQPLRVELQSVSNVFAIGLATYPLLRCGCDWLEHRLWSGKLRAVELSYVSPQRSRLLICLYERPHLSGRTRIPPHLQLVSQRQLGPVVQVSFCS